MRLLLALALAAALGVAARQSPRAETPTVPCNDVIARARSPEAGGRRLVLGAVAVPPAFLPQVVPSGRRDWPWWSKRGLLVAVGTPPVTLEVPAAGRARAAVAWGNAVPPVSSLRIASCPLVREGAGPRGNWNAYAGGFYLRTRTACVALVVRVAGRSETVRFGLGRPCPRQTQPFSSAMRSASARLRAPSFRIAALR